MRISEVWTEVPMTDGRAHIYACYTDPDWRGQGIYPTVLGEICSHARSEGVREIWIFALKDNRASVSGILHAGFKPIGSARRLVFLGRRLGPVWLKLPGRGM
jgi:RimJ/RimL family protein N-acetyltransferase